MARVFIGCSLPFCSPGQTLVFLGGFCFSCLVFHPKASGIICADFACLLFLGLFHVKQKSTHAISKKFHVEQDKDIFGRAIPLDWVRTIEASFGASPDDTYS
jgi:hypothetical protein